MHNKYVRIVHDPNSGRIGKLVKKVPTAPSIWCIQLILKNEYDLGITFLEDDAFEFVPKEEYFKEKLKSSFI